MQSLLPVLAFVLVIAGACSASGCTLAFEASPRRVPFSLREQTLADSSCANGRQRRNRPAHAAREHPRNPRTLLDGSFHDVFESSGDDLRERCGLEPDPAPASTLPSSASPGLLSDAQVASFWRDGYVLVPELLAGEEAAACASRFAGMFAGKFDTGVYPDEWHWREGISLPGAVREICNGWKSDSQIQQMVLDERFGKLACQLLGCPSARVAQDSLIWKPAGAGTVTWHQDAPYISHQFAPVCDNSITVWCALDDADAETVHACTHARPHTRTHPHTQTHITTNTNPP